MGLRILFGFVNSQSGFGEALRSFYVCAKFHQFKNLVDVDG